MQEAKEVCAFLVMEVCVHLYVCMCACTRVCVCAHVHACVHVFVFLLMIELNVQRNLSHTKMFFCLLKFDTVDASMYRHPRILCERDSLAMKG